MAKEAKKTAVTEEPKFPISKLRENARNLFKVSVATFDGATCGLSGDYSVKEMKTIIENWAKKPIK